MNYKFGIIDLGIITDFHTSAIEAMKGAEGYSSMSRSAGKQLIVKITLERCEIHIS